MGLMYLGGEVETSCEEGRRRGGKLLRPPQTPGVVDLVRFRVEGAKTSRDVRE